ncbi:MAG: methylated-DNA--[protein]-cysteine S-methyltransferase [Eubacteriales bacterium]|nr:methylated-DNA--[protein]-cysteine S-methyltransferase [Eubacteriales bacterium]
MKQIACYQSPLGCIQICYKENVLFGVDYCAAQTTEGKRSAFSDRVFTQLSEYLQGKRKHFSVPIALQGTEFQQKVWTALQAIPYGETRSYKEIAQAIGKPLACRAVGHANNQNPISIIVPCHRVIGANGKLVGYAGGLEIKQALLQLEREHK